MSLYASYGDSELFLRMKQGCELAFTEIYNRYWQKLFFVAGKKLDNLPLAEELIQDLFSDIWRRRETLEMPFGVSAYLGAALKYKIINARAKQHMESKYRQYAALHLSIADNSLDELLSFEELKDRLYESINKLPDRCKLSFTLNRQEGLRQKEIAIRMNISEKAVEHNIARAVKLLRINLRHFLTFVLLF